MAQPAETTPPALVEARRVNEPSAERDSKVEVEGSKETLADELLTKSRPAKVPTRPTVPMRSKSTRGVSAQKTTLRRARTAMQYQRGPRGYVFIVDLLDTTYEGEVEGEVGRGRDARLRVEGRIWAGEPKRTGSKRLQSSQQSLNRAMKRPWPSVAWLPRDRLVPSSVPCLIGYTRCRHPITSLSDTPTHDHTRATCIFGSLYFGHVLLALCNNQGGSLSALRLLIATKVIRQGNTNLETRIPNCCDA
jgi:hypothetical protein